METKAKEQIAFKLHTVILLVGPSNSGKSYFCREHLIPALRKACDNSAGFHENIQYLSSDDIRREVLGQSGLHKYDPRMMQVSDKAFKILHQRLDLAMEWPNNAQFVVVDTTGLNKDFRDRIVKQAKEANYNVAVVVFDYKKGDEYMRHVQAEDQDKRILFNHLKRLRQDVWPTINRKDFDQIVKLRDKDFQNLEITVKNFADFESCLLDPAKRYDVVSDVHGCLDELLALLKSRGYTINDEGVICMPNTDTGLIFVGDLIDKGRKSKEVIDFLHTQLWNPDVHFVKGNHENFVYKFIAGEIEDTGMPEEFRKHYFDCTETFAKDSETLTKFNELVAAMRPFFIHPRFVVTHSPCKNKFIGKLSSFSQKNQNRGISGMARLEGDKTLDDLVKEVEGQLSFIKDEANRNAPLHLFGHVAFRNVLTMKNKLGIDTGCAHGGRLTLCSLDHNAKPYFYSIPLMSESLHPEQLYDLWKGTNEGPQIDIQGLEPKEFGRIMWLARDKVGFISGTIAPAEADKEVNDLESFQKALDYYKSRGVKEVVAQPKYMGSRCNLYLSMNRDECFAVSRNGFKIKHIDMEPVYNKLMTDPKILALFGVGSKEKLNKMVVLDGELMPWHAMGSGLIDEQYKVVECGLESEFEYLKDSGFEQALAAAVAERNASGFQQERNVLDKKALGDKFGQAKASSYRTLDNVDCRPLSEHQAALSVYKDQIQIFGSPGAIDFKPFAILKVVDADDNETNYMSHGADNFKAFNAVSSDPCMNINLDDGSVLNLDSSAPEEGLAFFNTLTTQQKMEGVVIKPRYFTANVAPALKVRSPAYLTLIYGYDYRFPEKYGKLIAQKRTGRKMKTSIQEFDLGRRMLDIKLVDLNDQNQAFLQLAARMVLEERSERELDPRL